MFVFVGDGGEGEDLTGVGERLVMRAGAGAALPSLLQLVEVELIVACEDVLVCRDNKEIEIAETERDFSFLPFSRFCSLFRIETGGVEGETSAFACSTLDFHASTELSVFCEDNLVLVPRDVRVPIPRACEDNLLLVNRRSEKLEDMDSAEIERGFSFSFFSFSFLCSLWRIENETGGVEGETFSLSTLSLA